jgi:hypothetical protein
MRQQLLAIICFCSVPSALTAPFLPVQQEPGALAQTPGPVALSFQIGAKS